MMMEEGMLFILLSDDFFFYYLGTKVTACCHDSIVFGRKGSKAFSFSNCNNWATNPLFGWAIDLFDFTHSVAFSTDHLNNEHR